MSGRKKSAGSSKGKEKKGGNGKNPKSLPEIPAPAGSGVTELTKEFYTIQIRDLETRIFELKARCQELEAQNSELSETCEKQASDQRDIVEYLNAQLARKDSEIAALEEQIVQLESQKDAERDRYELELTTLATKSKEQTDQLTQQADLLRQKLDELREFRHHKEAYEARTAALEIQLQEREKENARVLSDLERKAVQDKDRLKKEMLQKVNEVISNFRDITDKQMAETTKRTIQENITITAQLAKMSAKTMELISQNEELVASEKRLRLRVEILEHAESEMAKKSRAQQKTIRLLLDRLKAAGSSAEGIKLPEEGAEPTLSRSFGGGAPLPPIHAENEPAAESREEYSDGDVGRLQRELEDARAEAAKASDAAASARREQERLMSLLSDTASFILVTLEEAKKQIGRDRIASTREDGAGSVQGNRRSDSAGGSRGRSGSADSRSSRHSSAGQRWSERDPVPKSLHGLSAAEREKVMNFLLSRLNTFQIIRQPFAVGGEGSYSQDGRVEFHAGIVPKQGQHSHTQHSPKRSQVHGEGSRSIGIQTESLPKAMFFAEQLVSKTAPKDGVAWDPTQVIAQIAPALDTIARSPPTQRAAAMKSLRKSLG